jgi:hypothetical protein
VMVPAAVGVTRNDLLPVCPLVITPKLQKILFAATRPQPGSLLTKLAVVANVSSAWTKVAVAGPLFRTVIV